MEGGVPGGRLVTRTGCETEVQPHTPPPPPIPVLSINGTELLLGSTPGGPVLVVVEKDIELPPRTAESGKDRLVKGKKRRKVLQLIPVEEYSPPKKAKLPRMGPWLTRQLKKKTGKKVYEKT